MAAFAAPDGCGMRPGGFHEASCVRSFFADSVKPTGFTQDQWRELRDFLFYFGAKYKDNTSKTNEVYSDKRRYAYSIGKYMNLLQHYYSELLMMTTMDGRLIVECFLGVFSAIEGFPPKATIGVKLGLVRAELSLVRTQLS